MAARLYGATTTIGGGTGAIDRTELDQGILNDGDSLLLAMNGFLDSYSLEGSSGVAEDNPDIIEPAYTGSLGNKRWIRQSVYVDARHWGRTITGATLNSAIAAIGSTNLRTLLIPRGTWTIETSPTVTSNITLKIVPGGELSVANTKTLTINSQPEAGLYQWISGAGSVSFGNLVAEVYPEWWGIDGTEDDVQINAALDSGDVVVKLQGKRYYIALPVYPNSNNSLIGAGRDITYLDYNGAATVDGKVEILNKDNVVVSDLTIDLNGIGTGNNATLLIDQGSTNIEINNVHLYDGHKLSLVIPTGSNIYINNLKVSKGNTSNAILIGQWDDTKHYATNLDLTDVFFTNILIEDVERDGFGLWNLSQIDGYNSVAKNININGLVVRNWGQLGLGYAFWGSGTDDGSGSYVTDVNLTNFNFENSDYASYPSGNAQGLHMELGDGWNHSNGTIRTLKKGDGSNSAGGYAITIGGGTNLNYDNITIVDPTIGVSSASTPATDVTLSNIHVRGAAYISYYMAGKRFKMVNCSAYQPSGSSLATAMQLLSTGASVEHFIVDNFSAYITHASSTYGITILGTGTINNVTLGKLDIDADYGVHINNYLHRHLVHGIRHEVKIRESVAAGDDYEVPILMAGPDEGGRIAILNVYLSFGGAIAQDASHYNTYKLQKYDSAGANPSTVGSTPNTNARDWTTKFVPVRIDIDSDNVDANLGESEILTLTKTHTGTGQAEADGVLTIEFVAW